VALAAIGFWFTMQQEDRQLETEEQRAQDAALQAHLDQMNTLLLEHDLLRSEKYSAVRILARPRTLTVLSRLGPEDKPSVLQFLYESDLILREVLGGWEIDSHPPDCTPQVELRGYEPVVSLRGADLSNAP
jgi:hypothetical protein